MLISKRSVSTMYLLISKGNFRHPAIFILYMSHKNDLGSQRQTTERLNITESHGILHKTTAGDRCS